MTTSYLTMPPTLQEQVPNLWHHAQYLSTTQMHQSREWVDRSSAGRRGGAGGVSDERTAAQIGSPGQTTEAAIHSRSR